MVDVNEVQVGTRWRRIHNQQVWKVTALHPNGTATIEHTQWYSGPLPQTLERSFIVSAFTRVL